MLIDNIKIDDYIANKIIDNTDFFENIEPNWITMSGMVLNFMILYHLIYSDSKLKVGVLLFFRWLADCLDGAVARKYKKTSDIGNKFDSVSDMLFWGMIVYWLWLVIENKIVCLVITVIWCILMYKHIFIDNVFVSHENIKKGNTLAKKIEAFNINNSYIGFIFIFILSNNLIRLNNILNKIKINI